MKRLFLSLYAILAVWGVKAADMPYSLELSQLYIIGDATPYAWDTSKTPDMEKINEGLFRWTGHLEAGKEFKLAYAKRFRKQNRLFLNTMIHFHQGRFQKKSRKRLTFAFYSYLCSCFDK